MRFARRSRAHIDLVDAVKSELTTIRSELRVALEIARRGDHQQQEQRTALVVGTLKDVAVAMIDRRDELCDAVQRMHQTSKELLTTQREQHRALLEAVERLTHALNASALTPTPAAGPRIVGGTIEPGRSSRLGEINIPGDTPGVGQPDVLLDGVEVRCRFADNRWVGGFEITDAFNDNGTLRYRLRRQSDRYLLPTLFDESSVRGVTSLRTQNR